MLKRTVNPARSQVHCRRRPSFATILSWQRPQTICMSYLVYAFKTWWGETVRLTDSPDFSLWRNLHSVEPIGAPQR